MKYTTLYTKTLPLFLLLLCMNSGLFATHVYGVEIWHEVLGGNQIALYERISYDCTAGLYINAPYSSFSAANAPAPLQLGVETPFGCTAPTFGLYTLVSFSEITPLCPTSGPTICTSGSSPLPGAVEITYKTIVTLPACGSSLPYTFYMAGCCRPGSVNSISTSALSYALRHEVYPLSKNSSPVGEGTPLFFCEGKESHIPMQVIDQDGDSISYHLVPALDGNNLTSIVQYLPGYSATDPLGPGYTVSLDSITGLLTISPTATAGLVKGVIAVRMDEYQNGILVGTSYRDLTITMGNCALGLQSPVLSGPTVVSGGNIGPGGEIEYCPGTTLEIEYTATDPNLTDTLQFSTSLVKFFPGATDTIIGTNPAVYRLTWPSTLADTNSAILSITVNDPSCPFPLNDVQSIILVPTGKCLVPQITGTTCQDSTGSIALSATGSPGPFSYLWNTGDTTPTISNIPVGIYWVDVIDSSDLSTLTDTFYLTANNIALSFSSLASSCDSSTGSISATVVGGTPPYSYQWNTGDTTAGISGYSSGGFNLLVTDSIGCIQYDVTTLDPPDSCFVEISGVLYQDLNNNCFQDPGEPVLQGILVDLSPGGMALTDSSGTYQFLVDTGSYQVTVFSQPYLGSNCPANGYSLVLPSYDDDTTTIDFGVDITSYLDLELFLLPSAAKWHDIVQYDICVINYGGITAPPTTWQLQYEDGLEYVYAQQFPTAVDTSQNTITWSVNSIPVSVCATYADSWVRFFVDSSEFAIGDLLQASAYTNNIAIDSFPANNIDSITQTVVAAYDPNDKLVTPAGIGEEGFILQSTKELEYAIRFQNTGNYPATIVVLRDTLSPHLELSQFRILGFSHPYSMTVEEDSILIFTFDNIMLPDSASDPLGSQGYIAFRLGVEAMLPVGTEITNQAAIYFDFNAPIYTNTTLNTIYVQPEVDAVAMGEYCEGDEIYAYLTTSGQAPHSWVWNTGDQSTSQSGIDSLILHEAGWYTVTVTDQFGFSGTDSVFVDVTGIPVADFAFETSFSSTVVEFSDSSQHAEVWLWDFGDGFTSTDSSPSHDYVFDGIYDVTLIVWNDCGSDTTRLAFEVKTVISIDDWPYAPLEVRPNPFTESTEILLPIYDRWDVTVVDVQGKMVLEESFTGTFHRLSRDRLAAGIYVLEVGNDRYRQRVKLVVRE